MPICSPSICLAFGLMWVRGGFGGQRWLFSSPFRGIANHLGVRQGAIFSSILVTAKLLPLVVLIGLGLLRFVEHGWVLPSSAVAVDSGPGAWLAALLLLVAAYGGWDGALAPTGEIKSAPQTIPIALGSGLAVAAALYALTQFVTLATIGTSATDRPVAEAASVLIGPAGALFVTVAVTRFDLRQYKRLHPECAKNYLRSCSQRGCSCCFRQAGIEVPYTGPCHCGLYAIRVVAGCFRNVRLGLGARGAGSLTILYGSICACLFKLPDSNHRESVYKCEEYSPRSESPYRLCC